MTANKIGRNDPCPCGTGLKYKKCCAAKDDAARSAELSAQATARAEAAAAKAAAEAEAEADQPGTGKAVKNAPSYNSKSGAAGQQRPKLPSPHNVSLPRRGAV